MRVAYLGPAGTFSEDALRAAAGRDDGRAACRRRRSTRRSRPSTTADADRALVPFENSIEGSVRPTLDALAFDAPGRDDRRRARPADLHQPDRARARSSSARSRSCSPIRRRARSARASSAPSCPGPRSGPRRAPPRPSARSRCPTRPWAALGAASAAAIYGLRGPARGRRGRGGQRDPVRLARPGRHGARPATVRGRPRSASPSSAPTTPARSSRR